MSIHSKSRIESRMAATRPGASCPGLGLLRSHYRMVTYRHNSLASVFRLCIIH